MRAHHSDPRWHPAQSTLSGNQQVVRSRMRLFVNVDHVATVRQARLADEPDPVRAAVLAELGGADGITVHLREDRRHIQDYDVDTLLRTADTPVNLEIAATSEMVGLACAWAPSKSTLVPEKREEVTTEGGLDLSTPAQLRVLEDASGRLRAAGVEVSLFVDPTPDAMRACRIIGADAVELHTGEYANATQSERRAQLDRLQTAARAARDLGLVVHAGHGLDYQNVDRVAAIREIVELNIGHSIVSRAVLHGMTESVATMVSTLNRATLRVRVEHS